MNVNPQRAHSSQFNQQACILMPQTQALFGVVPVAVFILGDPLAMQLLAHSVVPLAPSSGDRPTVVFRESLCPHEACEVVPAQLLNVAHREQGARPEVCSRDDSAKRKRDPREEEGNFRQPKRVHMPPKGNSCEAAGNGGSPTNSNQFSDQRCDRAVQMVSEASSEGAEGKVVELENISLAQTGLLFLTDDELLERVMALSQCGLTSWEISRRLISEKLLVDPYEVARAAIQNGIELVKKPSNTNRNVFRKNIIQEIVEQFPPGSPPTASVIVKLYPAFATGGTIDRKAILDFASKQDIPLGKESQSLSDTELSSAVVQAYQTLIRKGQFPSAEQLNSWVNRKFGFSLKVAKTLEIALKCQLSISTKKKTYYSDDELVKTMKGVLFPQGPSTFHAFRKELRERLGDSEDKTFPTDAKLKMIALQQKWELPEADEIWKKWIQQIMQENRVHTLLSLKGALRKENFVTLSITRLNEFTQKMGYKLKGQTKLERPR